MTSKPLLNHWAVYSDILVGEIWDHPDFPNGTRVYTLKVNDKLSRFPFEAVCADGVYRLGQPGYLEEYKYPQEFVKRFRKESDYGK